MASSLSKYGFRSKSYPFDWYHSNFRSVMHFIDTDFSDFLLKENLKVVPEKWPRFDDVKYDLRFSHDLKDENNFDLEYPDIYNKYERRIERFRKDIQNPTCFLRAVWTDDELQYIINNQSYIEQIIKRSNEFNTSVSKIASNYVITPIYDLETIKMWVSEHRPEVNLIPVDNLLQKVKSIGDR